MNCKNRMFLYNAMFVFDTKFVFLYFDTEEKIL